jgi:hypothetical protein
MKNLEQQHYPHDERAVSTVLNISSSDWQLVGEPSGDTQQHHSQFSVSNRLTDSVCRDSSQRATDLVVLQTLFAEIITTYERELHEELGTTALPS